MEKPSPSRKLTKAVTPQTWFVFILKLFEIDGMTECLTGHSFIHYIFIANYQQLTLYSELHDNRAAQKYYININLMVKKYLITIINIYFWCSAWANMWDFCANVSKYTWINNLIALDCCLNQSCWNKLCSLCRPMIYLLITHVSKFLNYLEILNTPVYLVSLNSICSVIFTSPHLTVVDQYYSSSFQ